jgi:hypothetical protein
MSVWRAKLAWSSGRPSLIQIEHSTVTPPDVLELPDDVTSWGAIARELARSTMNRERKQHLQRLGIEKRHELVHFVDPALRRVAIWLVMQVSSCPAPPAPMNALRLDTAPHVDFLGRWYHRLELARRAGAALAWA